MRNTVCFVFAAVAAVCCIAPAWALNSKAEARKLLDNTSLRSSSGRDDSAGSWIMFKASAPIKDGDEDQARRLAELEARKELGTFLDATISGETVAARKRTAEGVSSYFSTLSKSELNTRLAGARIVATEPINGVYYAIILLTEKASDARKAFQDAVTADGGPNTVKATGEGRTRDEALAAANRNALAQARGVDIVATDAATESDLTSRTYSDIQGVVEAYRVVEEEETADGGVRLTIVATISTDLKDSYGAELKSVGDPIFWITCDDVETRQVISDALMEKGLKTSLVQGTADYRVAIKADFKTLKHPVNKRSGTRLQLTIVCYDQGGVQLFTLQNDARKSTSFVGTAERQRQLALEKAAKQIAKPLHERLQRAIADVANNGRSVRVAFLNATGDDQLRLVERICETANNLPGVAGATIGRESDNPNTAIIRLTLRGNPQDFLSMLRRKVPECPPATEVSPNLIILKF